MRSLYNTVKPPNNGQIGGSNDVRCWEVVRTSEVIAEATPLIGGLGGCGLSLAARGYRFKRAIVDQEAKLLLMQPGTPLLKVEIRA